MAGRWIISVTEPWRKSPGLCPRTGKEQIERNSGKNAISLLNRGLRTRKKKTGRKQRNLFRKNWWI
ncbi:hypothetical protein LI273_12210 [Blautia glucerasea]|uniref:hypothetical protein n=1 Tax=Blautia glucerasea TaxID=536633 RepID=UPI001D062C1C|nr:hypothetical protein [Blautia glucerasea]MCB6370287.1 hypothetical protein [Blautia glucerasea]